MQRVAIVGGGLTGLSAAWELRQRGVDHLLFESSTRTGGAIQTVHKEGYLVECGPNAINTPDPSLDQLILELDLSNEVCTASTAAKKRYIIRHDRLTALPVSPADFLSTPLLSPLAKLRLLREPFVCTVSHPQEDMASFVERRFGKEPLDYVFSPLVGGVYAGDPAQLSAAEAFPKLYELETVYGSLFKGVIQQAIAKKRRREKLTQRILFSFKHGMQTLPDRMAEKCGTRIKLNQAVCAINAKPDGSWLINSEPFTDVLLTLPAHSQSRIDAPFDLTFLDNIQYPAVTSLSLGFDRRQIAHALDGFGFLAPACEKRFTLGVLFPSSVFEQRAPEGKVLLTAFIGGARHPERALLPQMELVDQVLSDFKDLLGLHGTPCFHHLTVWPASIPQYGIGYEKYKNALTAIEKRHSGIYFAGNYRDGISIAQALKSGRDAAERIASRPSDSSKERLAAKARRVGDRTEGG